MTLSFPLFVLQIPLCLRTTFLPGIIDPKALTSLEIFFCFLLIEVIFSMEDTHHIRLEHIISFLSSATPQLRSPIRLFPEVAVTTLRRIFRRDSCDDSRGNKNLPGTM